MKLSDLTKYLPFNNPAPAVALIVIFVVLFFTIRSCEAETMVEGGAGFLSGDYSQGQYLIAEERFDRGRYSVGIGVYGKQTCFCGTNDAPIPVHTNAYLFATRNVKWKRLELGLGAGYWQNTNRAIGKHVTFQLSVAVNVWSNLDIRIRHASNAGSGSPNLGQDSIGISWRFQ